MLLTAVQATKDNGQISVRTILQPRGEYITAPPLNPLNAQKTIAHEITESNKGGIDLARLTRITPNRNVYWPDRHSAVQGSAQMPSLRRLQAASRCRTQAGSHRYLLPLGREHHDVRLGRLGLSPGSRLVLANASPKSWSVSCPLRRRWLSRRVPLTNPFTSRSRAFVRRRQCRARHPCPRGRRGRCLPGRLRRDRRHRTLPQSGTGGQAAKGTGCRCAWPWPS